MEKKYECLQSFNIFKGIKSSYTNIFKNKKRLIPVLIVSIIWLITTVLPEYSINPFIVRLLSILTYAKAGISNNIINIIGGIFGKCVFTTAMYFVIDTFRKKEKFSIKETIKKMDLSKKSINLSLLGIGIALISFVIMSGKVSIYSLMGGAAALIVTFKNISNGGILSYIIAKLKIKNPLAVMTGISMGFGVSIITSLLNQTLITFLLGIFCIIASVVLLIINNKKSAVAVLAILLLMPTSIFAETNDSYSFKVNRSHYDKLEDVGKGGKVGRAFTEEEVLYHTFVEANDIQVKKVGDKYTFILPAYTKSYTEPIGDTTSTITVNYPELIFEGSDFDVSNKTATAIFNCSGSPKVIVTYDYSSSSGKTRKDISTYVYDNMTLKIEPKNLPLDKDNSINTVLSYDVTKTSEIDIGTADYHTDSYDQRNVYRNIYFSYDGGSINGYNFNGFNSLSKGSSTSRASSSSGETAVPVAAIIVIGAISTLASIGATTGRAEDEKKSKYFMYVKKDFGDGIRKGAKPVLVYARIVEINGDGAEIERNDLTSNIEVSGSNINILSSSVSGQYMAAEVSVDKDTTFDTGTLTFKFIGEGGSFENNIIFDLVGGVSIVFPEEKSYHNGMYLDVIEGDNNKYKVMFFFDNATGEPKEIKFEHSSDFKVTYEQADREKTYYAIVENLTKKKESGVFFKSNTSSVLIKAKFDNDDTVVSNSFDIIAYPEGISITTSNILDGRLRIDTNEVDESNTLQNKIKATGFEIILAYTNDKKEAVFAKNCDFKFSKLQGKQSYINRLNETFKYSIREMNKDENKYSFEPEVTLPIEDESFYAEIEISASKDGREFSRLVPIVLLGEQPSMPSDWDKEYELLKRAVLRYGLSDNSSSRTLIRCAKSFTANELCMVRRGIIIEACYYYSRENQEFMSLDASLGRYEFVFNTVKFVGDQAFSYLVTTYGGGPTVEAFASPLKDMFTEFVGEFIACKYNDQKVEYGPEHFYKSILSGCENTIVNVLTGQEVLTPNKAKSLVAGFLMVSFVKHYFYDDDCKNDVYKSLVAVFGDISVNFVKSKLGDVFKEIINKKLVNGKTLESMIKKLELDDMFDSDWSSVDIAEKYFTETLGLVVSDITKATNEAIYVNNEAGLTVCLGGYNVTFADSTAFATVLAKKAFDYLFDTFKTVFPEKPTPIFAGDCSKYYREESK